MARRMNEAELERLRGEVLALCEGRSRGVSGDDCMAVLNAVLDGCGWDGDCEGCPIFVSANDRDCAGLLAKLAATADWTGYAMAPEGIVALRYVEGGCRVQQSD